MSRPLTRFRWLLVHFVLLWLFGCTSQSTPTTLLSSGTQPAPEATRLAVTVTPVVLLPGTPSFLRVTPVATGTRSTPLAQAAPSLTPLVAASATSNVLVPILMYHQIKDLPANANVEDLTWTVSPSALDAELAYLANNGYTTVSLDLMLDGLAGKSALPPKPVVLTFDDGWKNQYTEALPLLKKYKQTATFYVVSSYMGYGAYFDWTMTKEAQDAGMTVAGHSIDHSDLSQKSAAEVDRQVRESKAALERQLGVSITHFAYPYGAYNDVIVDALKRNGYRSATTLNPMPAKNPLSPYLLPRIRVSYKDTLADFAKKLP
ncbi:MAG: polysaccharide deacetylase family protein [Chloroflexi bacterium]|nr:polysaccharide deacetylase family protein [Chloroflexota bacterium]